MPQSREEPSLTGTKDPRSAVRQANEDIKRIERSATCERAIKRVNWVMDALGPIAEVRVIPFYSP